MFYLNSITCVIRCPSDATDNEKADEDNINGADCRILQSILTDGYHELSNDDRAALEAVVATLIPSSDTEL